MMSSKKSNAAVAEPQADLPTNQIQVKEGTKTHKILMSYNRLQNVGEVANELGIKYQHVYNTLRMKGIQPKTSRSSSSDGKTLTDRMKEMTEEGKTAGEIARILTEERQATDANAKPVSYQQVYNSLKGNINRSAGE